jgi:hypothetical protein
LVDVALTVCCNDSDGGLISHNAPSVQALNVQSLLCGLLCAIDKPGTAATTPALRAGMVFGWALCDCVPSLDGKEAFMGASPLLPMFR